MKSTCPWFLTIVILTIVLLSGSLQGSASADDGWSTPDVWPFNNENEQTEAKSAPALRMPTFSFAWPQIHIPSLWPHFKLTPPVINPSAMLQPIKRFNMATKRMFDNAQSWNPLVDSSDPAPRLYDDHVTIGEFMGQPRLDP